MHAALLASQILEKLCTYVPSLMFLQLLSVVCLSLIFILCHDFEGTNCKQSVWLFHQPLSADQACNSYTVC